MERVSASLIEEIRNALVERYNRDQEIQRMIEEIGAEEGLNEKELFVIHQAYLEVKERMQYTENLMELWNQIEVVQDRMSMLNSYESLERDLFGDVLSFDKPMGYGASNQDNLDYAMEQVKLHDVDHDLEDIDDESVLDRDIRTSLDPYDMVNSLLYSKQSSGDKDKDKTKQQKEIDKLIKKQLKRVEEEWAKLSGKKAKKDKKKKDKDKKKDKESKKSKKDKDSKKSKKDKDAKKDKKAKKLEKALKKESKKSTKRTNRRFHK